MSTVMDTDLDTDLFVLLDFEPDIPCEDVTGKCPSPAEWNFVHACCGSTFVCCSKCHDEAVSFIEYSKKNGKRFNHPSRLGGCGAMKMVNPFVLIEKFR